jgi:hypothetical protein
MNFREFNTIFVPDGRRCFSVRFCGRVMGESVNLSKFTSSSKFYFDVPLCFLSFHPFILFLFSCYFHLFLDKCAYGGKIRSTVKQTMYKDFKMLKEASKCQLVSQEIRQIFFHGRRRSMFLPESHTNIMISCNVFGGFFFFSNFTITSFSDSLKNWHL